MKWRHSGFNVHCGRRIKPGDEQAIENLARYIIRASFSQERMTYVPEESKVIYQSKNGKNEKVFDALEWIAAMCSHVPNKEEHMIEGRASGQVYLHCAVFEPLSDEPPSFTSLC
ncbi:MAG: transposase [Deltaproteobacteria bacterium]|nr:transposase [Deltaproteobacteria bacterium]